METKNYSGIQALRFVAAMLVVLTHATGMVGERIFRLEGEHFWRPGMAGVDLFFVISGFVMATSSRKLVDVANGWKVFVYRRIIRIFPLYWMATTLKIVMLIAVPSVALNTSLDFWHAFSSYFFIPNFNPNGTLYFPIVKVGWTLMYEMLFYIVFAIALFFRVSAIKTASAVFIVFVCINILSTSDIPFAYGFLQPILLEFVMGMLVANFVRQPRTLNASIAVILVLLCFAVIVVGGDLPIWWRWIFWGLPSMVMVAIAAIFEDKLAPVLPSSFILLGDSSYSLYLFHTFIVPVVGVVLVKINLLSPVIAVAACMVLSPVICLYIYKMVELPTTNFLRSLKLLG